MFKYLFVALVGLYSCASHSAENDIGIAHDSTLPVAVYDTIGIDSLESEYADYYVVIADSGKDYSALRERMIRLKDKFRLEIDTMGRRYNPEKNLIALPEDDEDEMYAGDYFPRRFPSETLSLEYLTSYDPGAGEKTIAIVRGIYEQEKSADGHLTVLRNAGEKAYKLKARIYLGCMH